MAAKIGVGADGSCWLWVQSPPESQLSEPPLSTSLTLPSLGSSAYDVVLRQKVAVKKLSRPFQSLVHCRRSYRELRLLKHMKHENVSARRPPARAHVRAHAAIDRLVSSPQVIGLLDVFTPAAALEDFSEL